MTIEIGRSECGNLQRAMEREWLVTNGIGGLACGTVGDVNTRRYHGLLTAALSPPVGRTLLVAKMELQLRYRGEVYALSTNEYADGTIDPRGYLHLESFHLEQGLPVWRYAFSDALVEKRLLMRPGKNTTYFSLRVIRCSDRLEFEARPLCTYRDYHHHSQGGWELGLREIKNGFEVSAFSGARRYRVVCHRAHFVHDPVWFWRFKHRMETERGLDDVEDLFNPGRFAFYITEGEQATIVITAEPFEFENINRVQAQIRAQQNNLLASLPTEAPDWIRQLALASDQFIVARYRANKPIGKTIIAGYPWFSDWGRDTMIALPGLTLALRRFDVAANILHTLAGYVSQGMVPNRFPDVDEQPEYNTVDATLWFFHAVYQYTLHSNNTELAADLYPILTDIIDWHRRGTRYGIRVDENDSLLTAGEAGVQLTWMDAKVDDWVVTPRIGKAVEVNALWYNVLEIMSALSTSLKRTAQAEEYRLAAARVKLGFQRFWNTNLNCLYDVIDGPEGERGPDGHFYDDHIRPNQLFAVSLPFSPLSGPRQKAVVDICAQELLTSHGLRSLSSHDPNYVPRYQGGRVRRDGAYHQGTVWSWLIGPFVDAHYRVYGDASKARSFLEPLGLHLAEACLGNISEIFDAEPPFKPRGCFAQAWSVAEVLRAWLDVYRRGQAKPESDYESEQ